MFGVLFAIFVVLICLNYMFLDIKVDKIKKESLNKDQVIDSLIAHNKALCKLNNGFKDHERRIDNIERTLVIIGKFEKPEKPEKPDQPEYTCRHCKYYQPYNGIGFAEDVNYFKCEKTGCAYPIKCDKACHGFEKKKSLDEDVNTFYANNIKVDIPSTVYVYKTEGLLASEDLKDRIRKLYLDGGISFVDANTLLERLKQ